MSLGLAFARLRRGIAAEYFFRPNQACRRLVRRRPDKALDKVILPWGLPIEIDPREYIGYKIWSRGLYDLGTCEVLWRLTEPGELALDVGANIGQMTSILAARTGRLGRVFAFEPHPLVFARLEANAASWKPFAVAPVEVRPHALSDAPGAAELFVSSTFDENQGTSSLMNSPGRKGGLTVDLDTLDAVLGVQPAGVVKLDVERHEEAVLRGAARALNDRRIRDIVFEHHDPYPNSTTALLEAHGYAIIGFEADLFGLRSQVLSDRTPGFEKALNYIASANSERVLGRLSKPGWRVLRGRP